jgi:hypothetical protein
MLNFLLVPQHVLILLLLFAVLTALVAGGIWFWCKKNKPAFCKKQRWFQVLGSFGLLTLILWYIFNAIEDQWGLDSVVALCLNLLLFAAVGVGISAYLRDAENTH